MTSISPRPDPDAADAPADARPQDAGDAAATPVGGRAEASPGAAGGQPAAPWRDLKNRPQAPGPGLHLAATPIGNLRDVTLRVLDALALADRVLAEDTRQTRRLLDAYGIETRLQAYHEHNAEAARPAVLAALEAGEAVVLVTDAGTPLVSDPGYKLVRAAAEAGHAVTALPGASALLAGLVVSALPSDRFLFAGFPPPKSTARTRWYADLAGVRATLVLFEAPQRLAASLADAASVFGAREAAVARELTKRHEEAVRGPLPALAARYAEAGAPKGEIVLLIGPPRPDETADDPATVDAALAEALARTSPSKAAAEVAQATGLKKRDLYARALALKQSGGGAGG